MPNCIAVVTGASRGVGRGVATGLAASGFNVFATGRTINQALLPEGVIRIRCDHTKTEETDAVVSKYWMRLNTQEVRGSVQPSSTAYHKPLRDATLSP